MSEHAKDLFSQPVTCFVQADLERSTASPAIPLVILHADDLAAYLQTLPHAEQLQRWCEQQGFAARHAQMVCLPATDAGLAAVLIGVERPDLQLFSGLWSRLPTACYQLELATSATDCVHLETLYHAWMRASYVYRQQFAALLQAPSGAATSAKSSKSGEQKSLILSSTEISYWQQQAASEYLVRDLINTPANWMDPQQLASVVEQLAQAFNATFTCCQGDNLLTENYPAVHAVGKASAVEPRIVELAWGKASDPTLVLIGKGVCFDSGGLDIKSTVGMRHMKKDMSGAAHAIGLALLVMQHQLPVRLRLLVPAVENAVGGAAYRPGDILTMRQGTEVEITNTDAEGRLILADALTAACESKADLILDFASLTGAARVAVGPDIVPFFASNPALVASLQQVALEAECLHAMPLHQAYLRFLKSSVADLANAASKGFAGAITAALFLQQFVTDDIDWMHFDIYAWMDAAHGGEAAVQAIYAVLAWLQQRYT